MTVAPNCTPNFTLKSAAGLGATVMERVADTLDNLRSERHNLHEFLIAQLARDGTKHARSHRLADFINQHRRIRIEPDIGAVLAARLLAHPHDHASHHLAFLDG